MLQASSTRETRDAAREVKFLVSPDLARDVLAWARDRLAADPHAGGPSDDEYLTSSLYFDTGDFAVYRRRGSYRRSKLRIRRYGAADVVYLERKLRTSRLLSKRRTTVPIDDLRILASGTAEPSWPGYWFAQRVEARQLHPVCQVSYHRHARVGTGLYGPMRLTFDDQIVALPCGDFEFASGPGVPVLPNHTIIEMKYRVDPPAVLKQIIEMFALEPAPLSKYRLALDALADAGLTTGRHSANLREALQAPAHRAAGPINA
jgi:hypothetical protein